MAELNGAGQYRCCYVNVETAQAAREDVFRGVRAILSRLAESAWIYLQDGWLREHAQAILREVGAEDALAAVLGRWATRSASRSKPTGIAAGPSPERWWRRRRRR